MSTRRPSSKPIQVSLAVAAALVALPVSIAFARTPTHHDAPSSPPHTHGGELASGLVATLDDAVPATFWVTPLLECTGAPGATGISAPASCDGGEGFEWTVEVGGTAQELRVDWDQPFRQDDFGLTVTSPSGEEFTKNSNNTYSGGIIAPDPERGTWTIRLDAVRTDGTKVRMRAGLVDEVAPPDGALLPNLRVTPPFEFGFVAPASPLNPIFLAGDDQNPPLTVGGQSVTSCASDEVIEAADATRQDEPKLLTRCLRLSTGPHNVGAGHFDLRFPIVDRAIEDRDRLVEMTQFIHHTDGTLTERDAGTYEYHVTHAHWHYSDILFYEAYEVIDDEGTLARVGQGNKSGFCPADQGYGEWTTFDQGPAGAVGEQQGANCFATSGNGAMGLSAGWGDFYRWQRSGQYIDFSGVGDGHFVVRATVDVLGNVLETDKTDNTSYAYLCIEGDDIAVAERGYGMDPYDRTKIIATDNRAESGCEVRGLPTSAPAEAPASAPDVGAPAPPSPSAAPDQLPETGGGAAMAGLLLALGWSRGRRT